MTALLFAGAVMLLVFSLTPYIPSASLAVDLPSHFVLQYAIGAIILALAAALFKADAAVYATLALALALNLGQLFPLVAGKTAGTGEPFKILQANVLFLSAETEPLKNLIAREKPDIVLLSEVNSAFAGMFASIDGEYPHKSVLPKDRSAYGLAVLSKEPITVETLFLGSDRIPAQEIRTEHKGKPLYIVSFHPANPVGNITLRNREFDALAKRLNAEKAAHKIVSGDFNATPYSPVMKKLLKETGMSHARKGKGPHGTWLAWMPAFMRIPIDHTIVSSGIGVASFSAGPHINSDHLPTIAVLSID